ncbi:MAG: hypothetical protein ACOZF0_22160 [Thermodesulfobacteriota bacterium]
MPLQLEIRIWQQMGNIRFAAGEKIVDADDFVSICYQPFTQVGTQETGTSGNKYASFVKFGPPHKVLFPRRWYGEIMKKQMPNHIVRIENKQSKKDPVIRFRITGSFAAGQEVASIRRAATIPDSSGSIVETS